MAALPPINIFDPAFKRNPYPTYERLRREDPVHRLPLPSGRSHWLITRYDHAVQALKDPRFVKDFQKEVATRAMTELFPDFGIFKQISTHMLNSDPPEHGRLRALISKSFTPGMIEGMRGKVQSIADALLDRVAGRGEMDLINDYAFPLTINVLAEMLGVPPDDWDKIRSWSVILLAQMPTPDVMTQLREAIPAFTGYVGGLIKARRENPTNDLLSALVRAEEQGSRLSDEELYGTTLLLLVAGHETTVNLIANGTIALLQNPGELEKLRADPSLLKDAIDELLRYEGSLETGTVRFADADVEIGGTTIPRGDIVSIVLASANRDPEFFPEPDKLDLQRTGNKHVAFGHGIHHCLGAPLGRLEGQIGIATVLRRMPNLRLAADPMTLPRRPSFIMRSIVSVPVQF